MGSPCGATVRPGLPGWWALCSGRRRLPARAGGRRGASAQTEAPWAQPPMVAAEAAEAAAGVARASVSAAVAVVAAVVVAAAEVVVAAAAAAGRGRRLG